MSNPQLIIFLKSNTYKRLLFVLFLLLFVLGIYIIVKPDPFLKFGYFGIFAFNLLGGMGTYLIPTLSQKMNLILLALSTSLGMSFNDSISWAVGQGGTAILPKGKWTKKVDKLVQKHGFWALFILSILPFPYDAVGLISGYLGFSFRKFFIPTLLGKFIRIILIGLGTRQLIQLF